MIGVVVAAFIFAGLVSILAIVCSTVMFLDGLVLQPIAVLIFALMIDSTLTRLNITSS